MGARTDPAKVAVIRQEFMAGASLRDLAAKHGLGLRTLARLSQAGEWNQDRDGQRLATQLPALALAADDRAAAVNRSWEGRMAATVDSLGAVTERAAGLLSGMMDAATLEGSDLRELAGTLKVAVDALDKIKGMMPAGGGAIRARDPLDDMSLEELRQLAADLHIQNGDGVG